MAILINNHPMNIFYSIKWRLTKTLRIVERGYVHNTAYRRAAIMQSSRYSPHFSSLYEDKDEEFFSALKRRDYATMESIVDSFEGVAISEWDLSIPPKDLIDEPTAEHFCRIFNG